MNYTSDPVGSLKREEVESFNESSISKSENMKLILFIIGTTKLVDLNTGAHRLFLDMIKKIP